MEKRGRTVSVIGLGYAGLPVAVGFGNRYRTIGFDLKTERVRELRDGFDRNRQFTSVELAASGGLTVTDDPNELLAADFHIVVVPTPVDAAKQPDLGPLRSACEILGRRIRSGAIVVFESTVYPGATEEVCVPTLELASGLKCGADFSVGYSPERINPGDARHGFGNTRKVISALDEQTLGVVAGMYGSVVSAGVFRTRTIRVAEAAKVIENTQRDLNIALMNELALLCERMGLDTTEVLDAASTKWNFLPFRPGLVGGHCVGVDPYYLTHKAQRLGYQPEVILAGRRINDEMGRYVAQRTVKEMLRAGHHVPGSRVIVLGLAFKENCRDIRNTKVADIVTELGEYGVAVQVCDPLVCPDEAGGEYGISLRPLSDLAPAEAVILAVAHDCFRELPLSRLKAMLKPSGILVDVKGIYPPGLVRSEGIRGWRL